MKNSKWLTIFSLIICLLISGCASTRNKKVSGFTTTSAPELNKVNDLYVTTNNIHILEQEAILVDKYSTLGYQPGQIKDLIGGPDLVARINIIKVLSNYIELLGALTSGKDTTIIQQKASNISQSSSAKAATGVLSSQDLASALSVINSVTKMALDRSAKHKVYPIMQQANSSIRTICTLLNEDIDTLKIQINEDYQLVLMEQSQFIAKNKDNFSPTEKRSEIIKLVQIEQDNAKTISDLNETQKALTSLAQTHNKLAMEKK